MFVETAAPDWWDAALAALFPSNGEGPAAFARFGHAEGQMIDVWRIPPPGTGYVLSLSDGLGKLILWMEDHASYLDFITTRGATWLGLPRAK
jgi:hypothetical protein